MRELYLELSKAFTDESTRTLMEQFKIVRPCDNIQPWVSVT